MQFIWQSEIHRCLAEDCCMYRMSDSHIHLSSKNPDIKDTQTDVDWDLTFVYYHDSFQESYHHNKDHHIPSPLKPRALIQCKDAVLPV